jgi:RNA polymerase sigma factor (sigma-70 family)
VRRLTPTSELAADDLWTAPQRRRLVRLCSVLSGDRDAADDLAQETLLEAWRNLHKLHSSANVDAWLSAIARNVCRRSARTRSRDGRHIGAAEPDLSPPAGGDVEVELERAELAELLDQALARLPPVTREVLVQRYLWERPPAEIARRAGISGAAVSMRISRGKVILRRLLQSEFAEVANAYGLSSAGDDWRPVDVWCPVCGSRRVSVDIQPAPGSIRFRCQGCSPDPSLPASQFPMDNPVFAQLLGNLVRPTAILSRAADWSHRYFSPGAQARVGCTRCGRPVPLRRYIREHPGSPDVRPDDGHDPGSAEPGQRGLYAHCATCEEAVSSSLRGLALNQPEVREFRRRHPRTRSRPERTVEAAGAPAAVVGFSDVGGAASIDVVLSLDSLRVIAVHRTDQD